jgi:hypothetical protein
MEGRELISGPVKQTNGRFTLNFNILGGKQTNDRQLATKKHATTTSKRYIHYTNYKTTIDIIINEWVVSLSFENLRTIREVS